MHWFWESRNYTRALGDLVVKRMFDTSDAPFGTLLTTENIESHLAEIRQRRELYCVGHQVDDNRVRTVYSAAHWVLRSPAMAER